MLVAGAVAFFGTVHAQSATAAQTIRRSGRWYVRLGHVLGGSRVMMVLLETLDADEPK
jgi:hypothetical protein